MPPASRRSIRSAGPFTARPPISGLTATHGTRRCASASRSSRTARIGQTETYGLLGASRIRSASAIASSTPGAGRAASSPSKRTASTSSRCPRATNHSWNGNVPAGVSSQVRSRSSVAGSSRAATPSAVASRAVTAESGSPDAQRLCSHEMEPEITVAEREPVLAAERADRLERLPGLAAPPPAALLVREAGERVEDRVEIRRDVEAEHLDVVADVADHARRSRACDIDHAADEARTAHASREDDDVQATLLSSSARQACVRGPARSCSRVRSSIVSTSSARLGTATETASRPSDSARARKRSELLGP